MAKAPRSARPAKPKGPRKPKPGNESAFPDEVAEEILALLVEGKSMSEICRRKGMPKYRAVFYRLEVDQEFSANYARAREAQADADADKIGDIADRVVRGLMDPAAARVAIDAYKWTAGKRKPKAYGDRQEIEHTGGITITVTPDDAEL